jgi:hypothetical protein
LNLNPWREFSRSDNSSIFEDTDDFLFSPRYGIMLALPAGFGDLINRTDDPCGNPVPL